MRRLPLLKFLIAFLLCAVTGAARAQSPTLAGRWSATPMRSDWIIGEWGKACGPTPSGGGAVGGNVTITSSGGELHLSGAGRDYSTTECWEQFPGLSRISHSGGLRGWRSTCKTKAGDPRQATIVTTISATDSQISFDETGQYQFIITGQNCTASVRRTRGLSLVQREGESAPVASATPPAPSAAPASPSPSPSPTASASASATPTPAAKLCALPGSPERLEVRPARKLLRPGDSFEFHTSVLDAAGCAVPLSPLWKVVGEHASLELSGPGRVKVPDSAAESTVELLATLAGHSARVTVEIASKDRYDALLAQKGLNAEGESSDVAAARIATSALGGGSVVTRDDSQRRRIIFVGVVGGTALVLGLLGFALVQHGRRKPLEPEPRAPRTRLAPAITPNHLPPLGKVCPTCREEYPPEAAFCPNDGNRLVAARGNAEPTGPSGGVCPICGQGYDPGVLTCPKHGEELLPAAMQAGVRVTDAVPTKKICPVCGKQYTGDSQFCGGCGAALVPVN
ncbi:MAG: hypothetical protein WDO74_12210 [Pseudomonadota bacterium]